MSSNSKVPDTNKYSKKDIKAIEKIVEMGAGEYCDSIWRKNDSLWNKYAPFKEDPLTKPSDGSCLGCPMLVDSGDCGCRCLNEGFGYTSGSVYSMVQENLDNNNIIPDFENNEVYKRCLTILNVHKNLKLIKDL